MITVAVIRLEIHMQECSMHLLGTSVKNPRGPAPRGFSVAAFHSVR